MQLEGLEELIKVLGETLEFTKAYFNQTLSPEVVEAIAREQALGHAKTIAGALAVAKKAGWEAKGEE